MKLGRRLFRRWDRGIEFETGDTAAEFEKALHAEWLPPLSKR